MLFLHSVLTRGVKHIVRGPKLARLGFQSGPLDFCKYVMVVLVPAFN